MMTEAGDGGPPRRAQTSWYDRELVCEEGERILAAYDDRGIAELRRLHLVWGGWGPMLDLTGTGWLSIPGTPWGLREMIVADPVGLRLFFLSLLWRSAATSRPAFREILLPPVDLECLRRMMVDGDPGPVDFYPVTLTQLSTRRLVHNQAPFADTKVVPALDDQPERLVSIFRYYLDGLVAHVHRHPADDGYTASLGNQIVGGDKLAVGTVEYAASFQRENIAGIIGEAYERWPEQTTRLNGPRWFAELNDRLAAPSLWRPEDSNPS